MRYMLVIIGEEGGMEDATPEQMQAVMAAWNGYTEELKSAGAFIAGEGLSPTDAATTIRIGEGGERSTTDGPFAETKEQVGGFYLIECDGPRRGPRVGEEDPGAGAARSRSGRSWTTRPPEA